MLAIEIDGCSHEGKIDYDKTREDILKKLGITILRFKDIDVRKNIKEVLLEIEKQILKFPS